MNDDKSAGFDVYAYGVIASSTLHLLEHSFPAADGYAEVARSFRMTGGEALNSAIVMSRLGLRVRLDGNWLGDDDEGRLLRHQIESFGIDSERLVPGAADSGAREVVISDDETRTIFGNYAALLSSGRRWNTPVADDVAAARIVCVDPPFGAESRRAAELALAANVPFVSIDSPFDSDLASRASAIIVSGEFRAREYPDAAIDDLFEEYRRRSDGLVVLTQGAGPVLFGRRNGARAELDPFRTKVRDTAGAGDSFRAGLIYGMLEGMGDQDAVRYAAAVASLVCSSFPGVLNSPTDRDVQALLTSEAS